MTESHPNHFNTGHRISRKQKAVCVNLAELGMSSHICYEFLHFAIDPETYAKIIFLQQEQRIKMMKSQALISEL